MRMRSPGPEVLSVLGRPARRKPGTRGTPPGPMASTRNCRASAQEQQGIARPAPGSVPRRAPSVAPAAVETMRLA